jgi:CRP-like cAMP-binding protein
VSVRRKGAEIARLGPGDIFGEAAIVNHALRSASVVTLTKVEVIHFSREQVERLRQDLPAFATAVDRVAGERLGSS